MRIYGAQRARRQVEAILRESAALARLLDRTGIPLSVLERWDGDEGWQGSGPGRLGEFAIFSKPRRPRPPGLPGYLTRIGFAKLQDYAPARVGAMVQEGAVRALFRTLATYVPEADRREAEAVAERDGKAVMDELRRRAAIGEEAASDLLRDLAGSLPATRGWRLDAWAGKAAGNATLQAAAASAVPSGPLLVHSRAYWLVALKIAVLGQAGPDAAEGAAAARAAAAEELAVAHFPYYPGSVGVRWVLPERMIEAAADEALARLSDGRHAFQAAVSAMDGAVAASPSLRERQDVQAWRDGAKRGAAGKAGSDAAGAIPDPAAGEALAAPLRLALASRGEDVDATLRLALEHVMRIGTGGKGAGGPASAEEAEELISAIGRHPGLARALCGPGRIDHPAADDPDYACRWIRAEAYSVAFGLASALSWAAAPEWKQGERMGANLAERIRHACSEWRSASGGGPNPSDLLLACYRQGALGGTLSIPSRLAVIAAGDAEEISRFGASGDGQAFSALALGMRAGLRARAERFPSPAAAMVEPVATAMRAIGRMRAAASAGGKQGGPELAPASLAALRAAMEPLPPTLRAWVRDAAADAVASGATAVRAAIETAAEGAEADARVAGGLLLADYLDWAADGEGAGYGRASWKTHSASIRACCGAAASLPEDDGPPLETRMIEAGDEGFAGERGFFFRLSGSRLWSGPHPTYEDAEAEGRIRIGQLAEAARDRAALLEGELSLAREACARAEARLARMREADEAAGRTLGR